MEIQLKGLHMQLGTRLIDYCNEHLVEPLGRLYDREGARLEIELSDVNGPKGGQDKRCRLSLYMPYARSITVTQQAPDIYEAFDLCTARFLRTVRRYKGWKLDRPRRPLKYYLASVANGQRAPEAASPEELDPAEDSLAAAESEESAAASTT